MRETEPFCWRLTSSSLEETMLIHWHLQTYSAILGTSISCSYTRINLYKKGKYLIYYENNS